MASILKNILSFTGLTIGVPASLPHLLNVNSLALKPSLIAPSPIGYTITASSTMITVTRGADDAADVDVYVELWHSYEDAEPTGGIPTKPFIFTGGAGGGGPSAPTTEHVNFPTTGGGALNPALDASFASYTGLRPESPTPVDVTLADGTVDGFEKRIVLEISDEVVWTLIPANMAEGTQIAFPAGVNGAATLMWDPNYGIAGAWHVMSTQGGTIS